MKKTLILLFLYVSLTLSGATYYIAPNGSDSNPGTLTQPFFTLNKAWTVVAAGDIIYMRGGTYNYGTVMNSLSGKSGTSGNTIKVWAYPGEYPVIDYAGVNLTGQKIALRLNSISYVHFKGFRIANMAQENTSNAWPHYGIILYNDVSNCIFEQIEVDHIGGTGFTIADRCNNNLFLNCDSHHHADPYSSEPYGMSDGFESGSHGANTSTNNTFRGCRAWSNSDDGWDFRQADGVYVIDGCWSFRNGFIPGTSTTGGNGDGYKMGGKTSPGTSSILRTLKNSIAFENRATGITPEPDGSGDVFGLDIINCTSYKNSRDLGEGINTGNYNNYVRLRNCISYGNYRTNAWMQGGAVHDHNNWDIPKTVTDADFLSVNSSGVDGTRQSDGSLPGTNFLHLAAGSGLIDVGVDAGLAYSGNAPDLGAFEYQTGSPPPGPVYVSSCIANATPSILEITYNLSLANIVPASSSFSVLVNSTSRTVNSVVISGTKVQLTLSGPVVFGNVVTVAYTKPSSNPIQTAAGGQAITIGAQTVTNNVSAVAPAYVSSVIQNATPSLLEMTYNLSLANIIPAASSFSVLVNSTARTVSTVVISGTKVQLTLAIPVAYGDVVTIAYTKPSSNPIQTAAGGQAIAIGAQTVTNYVNAVSTGYIYVSPDGSDSNPGTITQPFFTLNKAWSVVTAGNTIYMRGGTYHYSTIMSVLSDKSGTPSNTIKIWAYPGEYPVIDYAGVSLTGQKIGLRLHNINYVHIKGLRICNMVQENISNAWTHYGIILYDDVSNCIFEQLEVDHIGGAGFTIADRCNNNLFLNCDSHHHQDPHTSRPYGASDGFESGSHGSNTSTNNTFKNCRAWSNSSNGWNLRQADGVYVIDNCWSFWNGFIPGTKTSAGSGAGYKLGGKTTPGTNSILRTLKNSLAFENRGTG
ncbi:MAG TPA: SwmB domain-containing protein, partial [Bacteroidales bacterium]|nr:SwmB domain-containing protein [Bacteroidales bacterium]